MEKKRTRKVNLFDTSSSYLNGFMYITLGILAGLLINGTLWQILRNKCKTEVDNNLISGKCHVINRRGTGLITSALNLK